MHWMIAIDIKLIGLFLSEVASLIVTVWLGSRYLLHKQNLPLLVFVDPKVSLKPIGLTV